jgi:hypothetical protein
VQRDAEQLADVAGILKVLGRLAVAFLVLGPVAHEQALHIVPRLEQEQGRDG